VPVSELTAKRLASTIKSVIENPDCYLNALALAKRVQSEPGVKLARQLIEELLQKTEVQKRDWDSRTSAESLQEREQKSLLQKQFMHGRRSSKISRTT